MSMAWIVTLSMVAAGGPEASVKPVPSSTAPGADVWRLTLPEAIRIGLKNSEVVRVVSEAKEGAKANGVGMTIARINADASVWNFEAAIMAHVRSIEQQYWALSQQQVQLWSRETAVELLGEIVRRERAKAGQGSASDVADAQQGLDRMKLSLDTAAADTITTERQLRNILGLPAVDGRRIVATTPPVEAKVEREWTQSLAAMMLHQPDILQQRQAVARAEAREPKASDAAKSPAPAGLPADVAAMFSTRMAKYQAMRQRAFLQQVIHQTTHSLARFSLEIDANYKQFQTAKRLREGAQKRLAQAQMYFDEGKAGFTIDRFIDAVNQFADAIVQEAQYKSSYNTSIAALEEAKGTLLATDGIEVVDATPREAGSMFVESFEPTPITRVEGSLDVDVKPADFPKPAAPKPAEPKAEARPSATVPGGRVITYDIAIEGGPVPIGLKGTVSIGTPAPHSPDGR